MNMNKRIVAAFLCLLILCLSACGRNNSTASAPTPDDGPASSVPSVLSLFYNAKDSLNPYTMTSEHNHKLQTLLYDPLVKITPSFQPELVIAESVDLKGKNCTVFLKSITFSDGSTLTASDVVYSIKLAKASTLNFVEQLANIKTYTAVDAKTVSITLDHHDPYFINMLTFPVIKAESEKRTDENKIVLPPVGSGRYVYNRETATLTANPTHINGLAPISTITLVDAPDKEVLNFNLESDNVDIYCSDLSDGKMPSMNGTVSAAPLNNLVFLGMNLNSAVLKAPEMRYALAYAVDRSQICAKAYHSYAIPATGLFTPLWEDAKGIQNLPSVPNLQNSIANLEDLGYNNKDNEGHLLNSKGKMITLSLICNEENDRRIAAAELIKTQFSAIGITVNVKVLPWNDYINALTYGNFDLYIAEVNFFNNMNVSELITSAGSLSYGIPETLKENTVAKPDTPPDSSNVTDSTPDIDGDGDGADVEENGNTNEPEEQYIINKALDDAVNSFYNGEASIVDVINAFNAEMPIIPVCYRSGITVLSPELDNNGISSVVDVYYGITNTKFK